MTLPPFLGALGAMHMHIIHFRGPTMVSPVD
jgi:hypothetical protein